MFIGLCKFTSLSFLDHKCKLCYCRSFKVNAKAQGIHFATVSAKKKGSGILFAIHFSSTTINQFNRIINFGFAQLLGTFVRQGDDFINNSRGKDRNLFAGY